MQVGSSVSRMKGWPVLFTILSSPTPAHNLPPSWKSSSQPSGKRQVCSCLWWWTPISSTGQGRKQTNKKHWKWEVKDTQKDAGWYAARNRRASYLVRQCSTAHLFRTSHLMPHTQLESHLQNDNNFTSLIGLLFRWYIIPCRNTLYNILWESTVN